LAFYDADHSALATWEFMFNVTKSLADEAVVVLDDWDRESVRTGTKNLPNWQLLAEMPEYTDGLTCAPQRFGYYFGVSVWGFKR